MSKKILFLLFLSAPLWSNSLICDLETAAYWDRKMNERLPVTYNDILSVGYFVTHSARMARMGEVGAGGAHTPPYDHLNFHLQPFEHFELSANYRLFNGVSDHLLSPQGFGDYADRGANMKLSFAIPEDSGNCLPGIAVGIDDFMGSKKFTAYYIVGTQVFIDYGLELSLGWGTRRYSKGPSKGVFGAIQWFPFFNHDYKWTKGLGFALEYDPINYKKDPHPGARKANTQFNPGIKYNFSDLINLSCSLIRGKAVAFSGSVHCYWGSAKGFIPKLKDPLFYRGPPTHEDHLMEQIADVMKEQGFILTQGWQTPEGMTFRVLNCKYRCEGVVRTRLQHVLGSLVPLDVPSVTLIIETFGMPCQQYTYRRDVLCKYMSKCICPFEFDLLTAREDARPPCGTLLYSCRPERWRFRPSPLFETFLGNAKGKFKYDLGIRVGVDGFLPGNIYYEALASYTALSTTGTIADCDSYNPSQLPNVLTDYVNYRKKRNLSAEKIYLQKNWNLGRGWFGALSGGYYQINYAGIGGEVLWYPAQSCFAVGLEGALLRKRRYTGFGFQDKLRKLKGFTPTWIPYTTLQQYFLSLYADIPQWKIALKASVGGFLAHDLGGRFELTRYFASGVRITGWMTVTNAYDHVNGKRYFNRGIALELPLDFFCRCSNRRVWNYGMAAWLRDAGAFIPVGKSLFEMIDRERRY